jgi:hypothetical protein
MVTLGVGLLLLRGREQAALITGGVDGLSGRRDVEALRRLPFDIAGRTPISTASPCSSRASSAAGA